MSQFELNGIRLDDDASIQVVNQVDGQRDVGRFVFGRVVDNRQFVGTRASVGIAARGIIVDHRGETFIDAINTRRRGVTRHRREDFEVIRADRIAQRIVQVVKIVHGDGVGDKNDHRVTVPTHLTS